MLEVKHISKKYITATADGCIEQIALNDISVSFRQSEFVAILGPSGSGKTTLLNAIGGLDKYDDGDIIVNGISTKEYTDRDWDSYRNKTIGFVFQNYNLIPHQTVLGNVELALTLAGTTKEERMAAAKTALYQVGLAGHIHKRPNQLSGGQMQRVAIARALVNNPDIVVADEPTGALDSETSIQIMNLLQNVAKDRLVIMVTHNQEIAEKYASRIINIKDGQIVSDSNPYDESDTELKVVFKKQNTSTMSLSTALDLSWNNLKTKKARTLLTAFAGSIGIVGIALVIALSTGVNKYIEKSQREIMASYPVTVEKEAIDLAFVLQEQFTIAMETETIERDELIYANLNTLDTSKQNNVVNNDLTAFKYWLDNSMNPIHQYINTNGVSYNYKMDCELFSYDTNGQLVSSKTIIPDVTQKEEQGDTLMTQVLSDKKGNMDALVQEQYELLEGKWPEAATDVVLMLNKNNEVSALSLYKLGILSSDDYIEKVNAIKNGESTTDLVQVDYSKVTGRTLKLVVESDKYLKQDDGSFLYYGDNVDTLTQVVDNYSTTITICGIVRATTSKPLYTEAIGYSAALTNYILDRINNSNVIQSQLNDTETNILTGYSFVATSDKDKIRESKNYIENMTNSEKAEFGKSYITSMRGNSDETREYLAEMTENDLIKVMNQQITAMTDNDYLKMYDVLITSDTYENNMKKFGYIQKESPDSIDIYINSFDNKNKVIQYIDAYNKSVDEEQQIKYTDYVGLMLSSITSIINSISYILIAFVGVSLVVSGIMIGIITNISVLERTKEIGVLRSIGASKQNISTVFNAETFIIGLASGSLGIILSLLLTIPINAIMQNVIKIQGIVAQLPIAAIAILIILSIIVTILGGLYPAKKASNMDPVKALRSE